MSLPLQFGDFMADTVEYGDRVLEWGFGRGDVCGRSRILDKTKEDDRGEPVEGLSCFHNLLPTRKRRRRSQRGYNHSEEFWASCVDRCLLRGWSNGGSVQRLLRNVRSFEECYYGRDPQRFSETRPQIPP